VHSIHLQKAKVLFIIVLVLLLTCQRPSRPPPGPYAGAELRLEQLSVICTEVWLKVSLAGVDSATQGSLEVSLIRNDTLIGNFQFLPPDTIIRDYGLQPGRSYRYRVVRTRGNGSPSPEVMVTTLDTTSHDFVWEIDTLGDYGSYLKDVWIVDEDDIWVVGYLEKTEYDSAGNRHTSWYDAAHWDGERWEFVLFGPAGVIGNGIYAFSDTNIWVATGIIYHWDGHEWHRYHLWDMGILSPEDGGVNKVWGSSPDDVYFVGSGGSIVHWDGEGFEKLESGTDIELTDIYGYDENNIWACGEDLTDSRSVILRFDGNRWIKIYERYSNHRNSMTDEYPYSPSAYTLWMVPHSYYFWFVGGVGTYQMSQELQPDSYRLIDLFEYFDRIGYIRRIRGSANNDIFLVGDHESIHWNGYTWRRLDAVAKSNRQFRSVDIYGNFIVICGMEWGEMFSKAIIVRGYHY